MNYAKAFKKIREENGLSRSDMAKTLEMTPGALWKIENGRVLPKQATIEAACFATKTPLARFFTLAFEPRDFASY